MRARTFVAAFIVGTSSLLLRFCRIPWSIENDVDGLNALVVDSSGAALWSTCHKDLEGRDVIQRGAFRDATTTLLSGLTCPAVVASREGVVFFRERGHLMRASFDGQNRAVLVESPTRVLGVSRSRVFFVKYGAMYSISTAGGEPEYLAAQIPEYADVNDDYLVWCDKADEHIWRMDLRDRSIKQLAWAIGVGDGSVTGLAIFKNQAVWSLDGSETLLYPPNDGAVWGVPLDGGHPKLLVEDLDHPFGLVADGNRLYWIQEKTTLARSTALPWVFPSVVGETEWGDPTVAAAGGKVYWTTQGVPGGSSRSIRTSLYPR
ncbi:DUF5050 domain-containing protein [Pendulispora rubella]|uniref:DUF5050 domain-containing protein n=1 Tax=Pendulispora rubella TaxID=2741070 RepID=A0ABZ2KTY4_9BACT